MSRRCDFELWREVTTTTVGLTGIVELFAKQVRGEDRVALAKEMIEHADGLAERAASWPPHGWRARRWVERVAAVMLRSRRG
jgi:hypothetical protein